MKAKHRFLIALISIFILSWVDYQFFTEGLSVIQMAEQKRRIAHLIIFALFIPIGYWGWQKHAYSWMRRLWLFAYIPAFLLILIIGFISWRWHLFPVSFLDKVSIVRIFFCSPVPCLILFMLYRMYIQQVQHQPDNK